MVPKHLTLISILSLRKLKKKILDKQEQSQAQLLGNHLYPGKLCLIGANRSIAPLRDISWIIINSKNFAILLRDSATNHLNDVHE